MLWHCVPREVVLAVDFNVVYVVVNFYFSIVNFWVWLCMLMNLKTKENQKLTEIKN